MAGDTEARIQGILSKFQSLDKVRELFAEINYDPAHDLLSRGSWSKATADALAEDPQIIATSGEFQVIYARLAKDSLLLGDERPVVNRLLQDHEYMLCLFSDKQQKQWHFVNVKYDTERSKRRLFRRITVSPDERLRTACERLSRIDAEGLNPDNPLDIQYKHDEAFDVEAVTEEFFKTYDKVFKSVENLIEGFGNAERKRLFTQRLFNRLMFIAFVQKKGWLKFNSKTDYLSALWNDYQQKYSPEDSFYQDRLKLLFLSGLNTPNDVNIIDINREGVLATLIGEVPYLNGGLFEEDEDDRNPRIVVPDSCIEAILHQLFNRFNFTIMESTPLDVEVAVDPEMLGMIFEKLVTGRNKKGSYYTPKTVVSFMCKESLKGYLGGYEKLIDGHDAIYITVVEARELLEKLQKVRICDPACGSGAYLVGMLHELNELTHLLDTRAEQETAQDEYHRKLKIIQNNLYGVDIDPFAVNIARLRLWLTLAVEYAGNTPEPLPNLAFKIEVGNSLASPDPSGGLQPDIFRETRIKRYVSLKEQHLMAHGPEKISLFNNIKELRSEIAAWSQADDRRILGFAWDVDFAEIFFGSADRQQECGFDIVIANPPYGIKCEDAIRYQYFPRVRGEELQSKDSYGIFMARALQLLKPGGFFSFIVSDTWRTIRTHRPLRKKLIVETTVLHVLDLPPWIFEATVNTCILNLQKKPVLEGHRIITGDLHNVPKGNWDMLEANLTAVASHSPDIQTTTYARYTYPQSLIASYDNLSFFIGSSSLYRVMSDSRFVRLKTIADVKAGLQTGDNTYYLRKRLGARGSYQILEKSKLMTEQQIAILTEDEKRNGVAPDRYDGRHFIPYDKGAESDSEEGWLPNYYVPTQYFIDWSKDAIQRMRTATIADVKRRKGEENKIRPSDETTIAAVIRNQEYYFREGLTVSRVGIYSPTFRIAANVPFDSGCSNIYFNNTDIDSACGLVCSTILKYLFMQFTNHTVNSQANDLKDLPMPKRITTQTGTTSQITLFVNRIVDKQKAYPYYAYWLHEQKDIDTLVYQLYGLTEEDIREVELWYCRRYPKLAEAQGVLNEVQEKYSSHLQRCELILSKPPGYWNSKPILQLVVRGEGQKLEFKETLEADINTGERRAEIRHSTLKTIAAFSNADGGTLLIGVSDNGEIKGLARDFNLCNRHNQDGFQQKLRSLLQTHFQPPPIGKVDIRFESLQEGIVCQVDVQASQDVIHLDNKVFVRDGNTTRELVGPTLTKWIKERITS